MTTYSVREFKAKASAILRGLQDGDEVIITRRGKPCAKLTPVPPPDSDKPSLATLEGALTFLPDATYEDLLEVQSTWEPRVPPNDGT